MTAVAGLLLALACLAIVALGFAVAVAAWAHADSTWGPRIARGAVVAVGASLLLLAAWQPAATLLALLPRTP
jgi:hypothetical protein